MFELGTPQPGCGINNNFLEYEQFSESDGFQNVNTQESTQPSAALGLEF